jgi:hypothetical protein
MYYELRCENAYYTDEKACSKLIFAILLNYKNSGREITSMRDFCKVIEISPCKEFLRIKFLEESQAAEFILYYGAEFHK